MKKLITILLVAVSAVSFTACGQPSQEDIVAEASPSVVKISGKLGSGTGFVYNAEEALVVTNEHVISGNPALKAEIGGVSTPVQIVGRSPCGDLAVVKLLQPPEDLVALPVAEEAPVAGEHVTALGFPGTFQNPAGQEIVATEGSVANPNAAANGTEELKYPDLIQVGAQIDAGNSGGPLLNDEGEVVGINTLGVNDAEASQSYSIDIQAALPEIDTLDDGESPGYIGLNAVPVDIVPVKTLAVYLIDAYNIPPDLAIQVANEVVSQRDGLYVDSVEPGSPAEKAQILPGDLIVSVNGAPVNSQTGLCNTVLSAAPGDTLRFGIIIIDSGETASDFGTSGDLDVKVPEE